MTGFEFGKDREKKIDKFLDNLAWFHNTKPAGDWTATAIKRLTESLEETIRKASESSDRLTRALNRITFAGVIVASIGILIALMNFLYW